MSYSAILLVAIDCLHFHSLRIAVQTMARCACGERMYESLRIQAERNQPGGSIRATRCSRNKGRNLLEIEGTSYPR